MAQGHLWDYNQGPSQILDPADGYTQRRVPLVSFRPNMVATAHSQVIFLPRTMRNPTRSAASIATASCRCRSRIVPT
jgi:hypothetical protein